MTIVLTLNETLQKILNIVEKMDEPEQKSLLAALNAKRYLKSKNYPRPTKGIKPLTMKQIDDIKHEVRKLYK